MTEFKTINIFSNVNPCTDFITDVKEEDEVLMTFPETSAEVNGRKPENIN
jgi:hypothetical protein